MMSAANPVDDANLVATMLAHGIPILLLRPTFLKTQWDAGIHDERGQ